MKEILEYISWIFIAVSLIGNFLVTSINRKYRFIAFILWVISNFFWVGYNLYFKHYSPAFMFSVYFITSSLGIWKNRNKKGE